jgi:haloalkane dehalogenase
VSHEPAGRAWTVLRTPEERFDDLPGFGWEPSYAQVRTPDGGSLRMAYLDLDPPTPTGAGGPDETGETVVLLHGEPTWSYLYRSMIPPLLAAGLRVVAPDLVGFGRSDKPADVSAHTYARHLEWLRALLVDHLGLREVTLVGQDWGGLLGLRLAVEQPGLVARVVAANTGLPTGDVPMPELWWRFREAVQSAPRLDVGWLVAAGCVRGLDEQARAGYDAPFPDEAYKAGPRAMPGLVPVSPDDPETSANRAAWAALGEWRRPFLVAFGDSDPITGGMAPILRRHVPGAAGLDHPTLERAGHFVQEDAGPQLAEQVVRLVRATAR